jgi:hypothetical protein
MNAETISYTIIGSQPGPIHSRRTRMDGPQMGSFLSLKTTIFLILNLKEK